MGAGLRRHRTTETVTVEPFTVRDGQGGPTYDPGQAIQAVVINEGEGLDRGDDGELGKALTTLMVDPSESPLPQRFDRLTLAGGAVRIVQHTDRPRDRRGNVDHVLVEAVEE